MPQIGIIGAGAWGTALAQLIRSEDENREVLIWAREPDVAEDINVRHQNGMYLPDIDLDPGLRATESLTKTADSDILLVVTPAQHVRKTLETLKADAASGRPVVICAKGIELETGKLMTEVAEEIMPGAPVAILTGPTFAAEIAKGLPAAATLAVRDKDIGQEIIEDISARTFRVYPSEDQLGAQIGGAVKNVIAIACGIAYGKKMGDSARAALITRGLAEMARLGSTIGAKKETLMGMCGIGDLMLTCSSMQSRNFSLGVALGEGRALQDILDERKSITEGVMTARALMTMAKNNAVEMPISGVVNKVLLGELGVNEAISALLDRPLTRPEGQ